MFSGQFHRGSRRIALLTVATLFFGVLGRSAAFAQQTPKVLFDSDETLFSVIAAINACGYDADLGSSSPIRQAVREEIAANLAKQGDAAEAKRDLCNFYRDHQQQDETRELSQYISLALNLSPPPTFAPRVKPSEMPPDATYVTGFAQPLQTFYQRADLHSIWQKHQKDYDALIEQNHEAISKIIQDTDLYLRMPISGYLGRGFSILLEPMMPAGQINARNYATEYYLVISPGASGTVNLQPIRHMYLHYVLDPLVTKRPGGIKRLEPLLPAVMTAPIEESYKRDMSLLVAESLIRAVEARMSGSGKTGEAIRAKAADDAVEEGFVLTRYFYNELIKFEKQPVGFKDAFPEMLYQMDVGAEKKRAEQVVFKAAPTPEPARAEPSQAPANLLDTAEQKLAAGDRDAAQKLAQQALDEKRGDQGEALFILARTARDIRGAQTYFERALEVGQEPRIVAWSHVYLGRIYDLLDERDEAVKHYKAALGAGYSAPEMKTAAETGLKQPYQPAKQQK